MAKRSKKEIVVRIETKNPHLKNLMAKKHHPKSMSDATKASWESLTLAENDRIRHIANVSAAMGIDVNDVIDVSRTMSDDELKTMSENSTTIIPVTFDANLTDEQIIRLLPILKRVVSMKTYDVDNVREWLGCCNREPVKAKNIGLVSYLLSLLSSEGYICQNWQHVASERKVFCSKTGKVITRVHYAQALTKLTTRAGKKPDKEIYDIVMGLKG